MIIEMILLGLLTLSLATNAYLLFKSSKAPKHRMDTRELQEFIGDLNTGGAMVAMKRIDPEDILLRSPKNR